MRVGLSGAARTADHPSADRSIATQRLSRASPTPIFRATSAIVRPVCLVDVLRSLLRDGREFTPAGHRPAGKEVQNTG